MTPPRVFALGSANLDVQVLAERWPEPGETLLAQRSLVASGGKAANVALLARRLGHPATLIATVGDDDFAARVLAPLEDAGIDLAPVVRRAGASTAMSLVFVREGGDKAIVLAPNANDEWDEAHVERATAALREAPKRSIVVVDFEIPAWVVQRVVAVAGGCGMRVVLDPSPGSRVTDDVLAAAHAVTPNPGEARRLCGVEVDDVDSAGRAGRALRDRGVDVAYVKLHGGGCVVVDAGGEHHVPARGEHAVDSTGAGDAFTGALAVALLEQQSTLASARFAVAAASLAVRTFGSQAAYPERATLERALRVSGE